MNFIEDFIFFVFTLLFALVVNYKFSYGSESVFEPGEYHSVQTGQNDKYEQLFCAKPKLSHLKADYLFIGEDHRDYKAKEFLIRYLKEFKNLGFKTIFLEYIETKDQHVLDAFNLDPIQHRESAFRTYGLPGDWGYDPYSYLKLTDHLGASGIQLRGLDRRSDLKSDPRLRLNPDQQMAIRDLHMAQVVGHYVIQNPNEKVIFLNGSSHSFHNLNLTSPSFYSLFKAQFPMLKTTNLKVDYYSSDSISSERLFLYRNKVDFRCENDFILYSPVNHEFDFYIFEDTNNFLPTTDYHSSVKI